MGGIGCFRKLEDWMWGMMMVNQSTQERRYEGGRSELNVKLGSGIGGALRKRLVVVSV